MSLPISSFNALQTPMAVQNPTIASGVSAGSVFDGRGTSFLDPADILKNVNGFTSSITPATTPKLSNTLFPAVNLGKNPDSLAIFNGTNRALKSILTKNLDTITNPPKPAPTAAVLYGLPVALVGGLGMFPAQQVSPPAPQIGFLPAYLAGAVPSAQPNPPQSPQIGFLPAYLAGAIPSAQPNPPQSPQIGFLPAYLAGAIPSAQPNPPQSPQIGFLPAYLTGGIPGSQPNPPQSSISRNLNPLTWQNPNADDILLGVLQAQNSILGLDQPATNSGAALFGQGIAAIPAILAPVVVNKPSSKPATGSPPAPKKPPTKPTSTQAGSNYEAQMALMMQMMYGMNTSITALYQQLMQQSNKPAGSPS